MACRAKDQNLETEEALKTAWRESFGQQEIKDFKNVKKMEDCKSSHNVMRLLFIREGGWSWLLKLHNIIHAWTVQEEKKECLLAKLLQLTSKK